MYSSPFINILDSDNTLSPSGLLSRLPSLNQATADMPQQTGSTGTFKASGTAGQHTDRAGQNEDDGFWFHWQGVPDRDELPADSPLHRLSDNELFGVQNGFLIPYWKHPQTKQWIADDPANPADHGYMAKQGFEPMAGIVGIRNITADRPGKIAAAHGLSSYAAPEKTNAAGPEIAAQTAAPDMPQPGIHYIPVPQQDGGPVGPYGQPDVVQSPAHDKAFQEWYEKRVREGKPVHDFRLWYGKQR